MIKTILLFTFLFLIYFILAIPYYSGDVKNHEAWAASFLSNPIGFYEREIPGFYTPNYPPVTIWLFVLGDILYQISKQAIWSLNLLIPFFPSHLVSFWEWENVKYAFLKLPAILANILLAYGIYIFLPLLKNNVEKKFRMAVAGFFLFNPASLYLSALWGQVDLLPIAFLILSVYLFFKSKVYWSAALMCLAILSKQTVAIFLPVYIYLVLERYGGYLVGRVAILMLGVFYLSFLPFHELSVIWPVQFYLSTFSSVALTVGENAFNFWGFLFNFTKGISDQQIFLLLKFYQWGLVLMVIFLLCPLYIFLKRGPSPKRLISLFFLISIIYFFFLTRMHERHLAPAIFFGTILTSLDRRYLFSLIFISFLFLLNMYNGSFMPNIPIFNQMVSSLIFLKMLVVGYFLVILYNLYLYLWEK